MMNDDKHTIVKSTPRIAKILLVFDDGSTQEVDSSAVRKYQDVILASDHPKVSIGLAIAVLTIMDHAFNR
jgi:hypothetical protein